MVNIRYDEETGILELTYAVSVDQKDVDRFIEYLQSDDRLGDDLKILHNAATTASTLKMKDLMHFSKEMKKGTARFKSVRAAVYTTNSLSLTLSKMYEKLNMDKNTKFKTFNSERAAVAWLVEI